MYFCHSYLLIIPIRTGGLIRLCKDDTSLCCCAYVLLISGWSGKLRFLEDGTYQYKGIFGQFMTRREKQTLSRAVGIQKKIGGTHAFFLEINELRFGKKVPYIVVHFKAF